MKMVEKLLFFLIVFLVGLFLGAFGIMCFLGAVHSTDGRIPDLSYWNTCGILLAIYVAVSAVNLMRFDPDDIR